MKNLGAIRSPKDRRDFHLAGIESPKIIPDSFKLKSMAFVKDQDQPSCVGQANANHKSFQEKEEISGEYIYGRCKEIDGYSGKGTYGRIAAKVVCDYGSPLERLYPEKKGVSHAKYIDLSDAGPAIIEDAQQHCSRSYWRVATTPKAEPIKQAIYQNQCPVTLVVPWYDTYRPNSNGYVWLPSSHSKYLGGHAISVEGYTRKWLWCKNSFGKNWGVNGYFWLSIHAPMWGAWMTLDLPKHYPVDKKYGQPRTWTGLLREIKCILNLWLYNKIGRVPSMRETWALAYGYWDWEAVFRGSVGDTWLYLTKSEYLKNLEI